MQKLRAEGDEERDEEEDGKGTGSEENEVVEVILCFFFVFRFYILCSPLYGMWGKRISTLATFNTARLSGRKEESRRFGSYETSFLFGRSISN